MAQIVNLTSFVGTAGQELSAADANWTQTYQGGSGIGTISDAARVYQSASSEAVYVRSETPGSANQTVAATIRQVAVLSSGNHAGVVARKKSGVNTYITGVLRSESGGRQIRAYKVVGGTATQIGTSVSVTTTNSTDYALQLEVTGQSPNLRVVVKLDDTTHIDQTINDTNLDAAGSVGIRFGFGTSASSNTTGLHIATFTASDDTGGDTTAPTLTSPSATATGTTTASGSVSTNEANGTLYWIASANATESVATVKAGSSQAVTATGVQNVTLTGLTASTSYYLHFAHTDAAANDSAVETSAQFTTSAAGDADPPTLTGSVTFASITQTSYTASWPAGSDNVAVTGYEYQIGSTAGAWTDAGNNLSAAISGRTAGTTETVYVRAYDAAGLRSTPAISGEVTLESIPASGINVTEPLKNNTGTVLASQSGVRVAVLQAADLVSVYEATGLTTNASGILATISNAAITAGQQYHVAIKLADGSVGITGPITAS